MLHIFELISAPPWNTIYLHGQLLDQRLCAFLMGRQIKASNTEYRYFWGAFLWWAAGGWESMELSCGDGPGGGRFGGWVEGRVGPGWRTNGPARGRLAVWLLWAQAGIGAVRNFGKSL